MRSNGRYGQAHRTTNQRGTKIQGFDIASYQDVADRIKTFGWPPEAPADKGHPGAELCRDASISIRALLAKVEKTEDKVATMKAEAADAAFRGKERGSAQPGAEVELVTEMIEAAQLKERRKERREGRNGSLDGRIRETSRETMTPKDYLRIRTDLKLTQAALARLLGLASARSIRRYETGERTPGGPIRMLYKWLDEERNDDEVRLRH